MYQIKPVLYELANKVPNPLWVWTKWDHGSYSLNPGSPTVLPIKSEGYYYTDLEYQIVAVMYVRQGSDHETPASLACALAIFFNSDLNLEEWDRLRLEKDAKQFIHKQLSFKDFKQSILRLS